MDHCVLLLQGYKRFSRTNSTDPRQRVPLIHIGGRIKTNYTHHSSQLQRNWKLLRWWENQLTKRSMQLRFILSSLSYRSSVACASCGSIALRLRFITWTQYHTQNFLFALIFKKDDQIIYLPFQLCYHFIIYFGYSTRPGITLRPWRLWTAECGFESRSWHACPLQRQLNHDAGILWWDVKPWVPRVM